MSDPKVPTLPPYGPMPLEFLDHPTRLVQPAQWNGAMDYAAWIDTVSALFAEKCWPIFDVASGSWKGAAAANMIDLTLADLELLPELQAQFTAKARNLPLTHGDLFGIEDADDATFVSDELKIVIDRSIDRSLRLYLKPTGVDPEILAAAHIARMGKAVGWLPLHLKQQLQRPRAHQAAFMLGRPFTYHIAGSAASPAMVSGHSYQGLYSGITSFYHAKQRGLGAPVLKALAQYAVDVGDRRVFAGVHYPSDNVASWISGLLAAPFIFSDSKGTSWAWGAITGGSSVYAAIRDGLAAGKYAAFRSSWDWLHDIAAKDHATIIKELSRLVPTSAPKR